MSTRSQTMQQNKLRRFQTDQRKLLNIMKSKSEKRTSRQRMPKRNTVAMPNETVLRFITLVKRNSCLWNPKNRQFRNKAQEEKAWNDIAEVMGFSVDELKDKWVSLKSSFRAYQIKFVSEPEKARKWFAFDAIKFLATPSNSAVRCYDTSSPNKEELVIEVCKNEDGTIDYYDEEHEDGEDEENSVTLESSEPCEELKMAHSTTTTNSCVPEVEPKLPMDVTLDRSSIFGQSISVKLKCLDRRQQMIAEKIISDIMFEAELGNLTTEHVWDIQQVLRNSQPSAMKRIGNYGVNDGRKDETTV
ncbi:uncharacterized protein LOC126559931 [Anopheles maculipalpis]|uniref:uncharacterized protein LOC126559931 n=1 Tax=Anopheles maculipalpis TaxID=1496333 RepID=UPI0021591FBD|nr:uncharacterized protein LOC126559931 [Anopheles maculipalpis]